MGREKRGRGERNREICPEKRGVSALEREKRGRGERNKGIMPIVYRSQVRFCGFPANEEIYIGSGKEIISSVNLITICETKQYLPDIGYVETIIKEFKEFFLL